MIAPATLAALAKSTSPTIVPFSNTLIPKSTTTADIQTVETALKKLTKDPKALYQAPVLAALRAIHQTSPATYARYRTEAKVIDRKFSVPSST